MSNGTFEAGMAAPGHNYYTHVDHAFPALLAAGQEQFGGYSYVSETEIVARSPISGLKPVIDQAIAQIKAAKPNLEGLALESAIALKLTQLNDWGALTTATQNQIMIMSGIDFGSMSAAEQETSINHLLHSPLAFGNITDTLTSDTTIYMSFTHTLDKAKTTAEDLGDGLYKISMISNNNNGSHTGHNLGSFVIDMNGYASEQWAVSGSASSSYSTGASYSVNAALGATNAGNAASSAAVWMAKSANGGEQWLELDYGSAVNATGVNIHQNYGSGFVTKVELKDADGNYYTVWAGEDDTAAGGVLSINFDQTDFMTQSVRVTIETSGSGWEGIDAIQLLGENADGSGLEDLAKEIGNDMVVNTNDNNQLYLADAARDVLYGRDADEEDGYYDETGMYVNENGATEGFDHSSEFEAGEASAGHNYYAHVANKYPDLLADGQTAYGGYTWISENEIVARAPITGLKPVIDQAIAQVKAAKPNLEGQALESAIAQKLTQLNDWGQLTTATQNQLMIMSGIDFGSMTAAEQETSINHLLHSPLSFGEIAKPLDTDVKIFMEYTHTLDKAKTTAEHLGDGLYKVSIISNNNNGSHTGHSLGSFVIDMNDYAGQQWAVSGSASSSYSTGASYSVNAALGAADAGNAASSSKVWMTSTANQGEQWLELDYGSAVNATGVNIHQNYGNGFVTKVELKDADGKYYTVWAGEDDTAAGGVLSLRFDETDFMTQSVRVTVDTSGSGWEGIDAVQLIGTGADGSGLEDLAKEIGNDMIVNTNNNAKLYLDQAAKNVLYGTDYDKGQSDDGYSGQSDGSEDAQPTQHVHGNSSLYTWEASEDGENLLLTKGSTVTVLPANVILQFHDRNVDTSSLFEDEGGQEGNVYRIDGNSADWGWDRTEDGLGVVVWSGSDFMILEANVVLKFNDQSVDTAYLFEDDGEDGNVFKVDGNSSDWAWGLTQDEAGVVIWSGSEFYILEANVVLEFNDETVDTSYLFEDEGGEEPEEDVLVIDGNSGDYGWGPTEDGSAIVVWKDAFFEIVDAGTTLRFNDRDVETEAADDSSTSTASENSVDESDEMAMDDMTGTDTDNAYVSYGDDMVA